MFVPQMMTAAGHPRRRAPTHECRDDVIVGRVEDLLRGVEPEAIDVVFADPVFGAGEHQLAQRPRTRAVEIERVAPFVVVPVGEIVLCEARQVVAVRPEVVVDDVEDDAEAERVRGIDEARRSSGRP
jgi:hypothetical protein